MRAVKLGPRDVCAPPRGALQRARDPRLHPRRRPDPAHAGRGAVRVVPLWLLGICGDELSGQGGPRDADESRALVPL